MNSPITQPEMSVKLQEVVTLCFQASMGASYLAGKTELPAADRVREIDKIKGIVREINNTLDYVLAGMNRPF